MRARCSVFITTSLDGFIARSDGSIDWLMEANASVPPGEDYGYKDFISTVSGVNIGRNTFEQVLSLGGWAYEATPVNVMTRREITLPAHLPVTVTVSQELPCDLVDSLSQDGAKRL